MKKIILTLTILTAFVVAGFSQTLNKNMLCKKWYLEKYEIFWIDYEPEEKEKNDYIHLKSDMTYISIDEGEFSTGKWTYNAAKKHFILFDDKGEGLKFIVDELKDSVMTVNVDIEEMDGVDIHFITK